MRKNRAQSDAKRNDGTLSLLLNDIVEFDDSSLYVVEYAIYQKRFQEFRDI